MAAPVGWETASLPDGAETLQVEETTYYYHEAAFYQNTPGGGYVVVKPPVGAEVSSIPEEAKAPNEEEPDLYQFDKTFFTKDTNDAGKTIYRVEPQPPEVRRSREHDLETRLTILPRAEDGYGQGYKHFSCRDDIGTPKSQGTFRRPRADAQPWCELHFGAGWVR